MNAGWRLNTDQSTFLEVAVMTFSVISRWTQLDDTKSKPKLDVHPLMVQLKSGLKKHAFLCQNGAFSLHDEVLS